MSPWVSPTASWSSPTSVTPPAYLAHHQRPPSRTRTMEDLRAASSLHFGEYKLDLTWRAQLGRSNDHGCRRSSSLPSTAPSRSLVSSDRFLRRGGAILTSMAFGKRPRSGGPQLEQRFAWSAPQRYGGRKVPPRRPILEKPWLRTGATTHLEGLAAGRYVWCDIRGRYQRSTSQLARRLGLLEEFLLKRGLQK
jgi:hypothetical protein